MQKEARVSDYLSIILKWKKFLIINVIFIIIISIVIAFLITTTFRASSTLMIPKEDKMLGGQLSGLLGSGGSLLSGGLLGGGSNGSDQMIGILNSRTMLAELVNRFNLFSYYGIKDKNYDKVLKNFRGDFGCNIDDNNMIEISMVHENPDTSAMIVNYAVWMLDSLNTNFNIIQAKSNRQFIEIRYKKNLNDMAMAEDSMKKFQQQYGIFAIPEQLEAAVKVVGELEAQVAQKELTLNSMKFELGENSPLIINMEEQIKIIKNKLKEVSSSNQLSDKSLVLFPFKKIPEMGEIYYRLYREVQIQGKIMEVILPLYEKAKIDEQKSIPTVMVLDKAYPPELKYQPKRALIILEITFPFFFIFLMMIFRGEYILKSNESRNQFEKRESEFYMRINHFYRMKLNS
jgi:capsule polysaccharide export protein KpsE/RkpR